MSIIEQLPSRLQTDLLAADIDVSDFTDAELSAKQAMQDFAGIKARLGAKTALALFNLRVSRWANSFTNKRLAEIAYTLGSAMNGGTHSRQISVNGIYAGRVGMRDKVAPHSLRDKYQQLHKGKAVSYEKLCRYLKELEDLGIAVRTNASDLSPGAKGRQPERQTRDGDNPGGYQRNTWHVDFSKVVQDGDVMPHWFAAEVPGQAEILEKCTRDASRDASLDASWPASHISSSLQLHNSSPLQQPKTEKASLSEEKTKTEELGTCGAGGCDRPAEYRGPDPSPGRELLVVCNEHLASMHPMGRKIMFRPGDGPDGPPVRPDEPEHQEKSQDVENDYWVYYDGQFYKKSQHDPNHDRPGGVRLVHLTRAEGVYLWGALKKFGQAPNSTQQRYMAWKAFGKELPPGMPKLPREKSRRVSEW